MNGNDDNIHFDSMMMYGNNMDIHHNHINNINDDDDDDINSHLQRSNCKNQIIQSLTISSSSESQLPLQQQHIILVPPQQNQQ
jgi:hypothetical protein